MVTDDGTYLKNGSLDLGESVEGAVSFNVKKGVTDLRIRYSKELFNGL